MAVQGLYAVTPDTVATPWLLERVESALRGGVRIVQYRSKHVDLVLRRQQAAGLRGLTREHGAMLLINDDVALAKASGADGVHLGRDDGSISRARELLGPRGLVGASCYDSLDAARRACAEGADYVAFGSFFPSQVKPQAVRPPVHLISQARSLGMPVVVIGGITPENAAPLLEAGADALAVVSALFSVEDTYSAAACFIKLIRRYRAVAPGLGEQTR